MLCCKQAMAYCHTLASTGTNGGCEIRVHRRRTVGAELKAEVHSGIVLEGEVQACDAGVAAAVQDVAFLPQLPHQAVPKHHVLVHHLQRVHAPRHLVPYLRQSATS